MAHPTQRQRDGRRQKERARRARVLEHTTVWIDHYKTERGCTDCGFDRWPESLHFDHVDPATKLRALGWFDDRTKVGSWAKLERFQAHVRRYCEVRCANCHAHRSRAEEHWRATPAPDHGLTLF